MHTDIAMLGAQQLIKACTGWGLLTGYTRGFVDDQNALLMVDCGVSRHVGSDKSLICTEADCAQAGAYC